MNVKIRRSTKIPREMKREGSFGKKRVFCGQNQILWLCN